MHIKQSLCAWYCDKQWVIKVNLGTDLSTWCSVNSFPQRVENWILNFDSSGWRAFYVSILRSMAEEAVQRATFFSNHQVSAEDLELLATPAF